MELGVGFRRGFFLFETRAPLQVLGDIVTRRKKNRIQSRGGKLICSCWHVDFVCCLVCVRMWPICLCMFHMCSCVRYAYLCVCVCVCVCAGVLVHGLPTCVRSHFSVIAYMCTGICSPESAGLWSCNGVVMDFQIC